MRRMLWNLSLNNTCTNDIISSGVWSGGLSRSSISSEYDRVSIGSVISDHRPRHLSPSSSRRRSTVDRQTRVRIQLENNFPPRRGFEFNFKKVSRQDEGSNST